jgi:hypothetical protein
MGVSFVLSRRGLSRNESMSLFNFPNKAAEDENTDVVLDNLSEKCLKMSTERQKMEQEQQRKSYVLLNVSHSLDRPLLKAVDETTPQEMPTIYSISC